MEVCFCFDAGRCETNDCVHHQFYAIAQCCGTAQNRSNAHACDTSLQTIIDFFFCQFFIIEEFFHQFFAGFCSYFDYHGTQFFNLVNFIFGHWTFLQFAVYFLSCVSLDYVDETNEFTVFIIEGDLNGSNCFTEFFTQFSQCSFEVSVFIIHLVNEEHTRQVHFFTVFPCFFCTYFNAGFCRYHDHTCISYVHSQFYFSCKVKVTGCIQEVDFCILPFNRDHGCIDRNLTADFFCFIVRHCVTVFNFTKAFCCTGIVQRCFSVCCFTGTTVAQKYYVSYSVGCIIFHRLFPSHRLFINGQAV